MESMASTPVYAKARVLRDVSTNELNASNRQNATNHKVDGDCKTLIKKMSSEKKVNKIQRTKSDISDHGCTHHSSPLSNMYSMLFPPGSMGLHLEPVTAEDVGAKVKGYHNSSPSAGGISAAVIKEKVRVGDIITLVDNVEVSQMPFKNIYNMLVSKISSNKLVTFEKSNELSVDDKVITHRLDTKACNVNNEKVESMSVHSVLDLKELFPVRYDELSHILLGVSSHIASIGGTVEKGMVSVGTSFENKTVEVLDNTVKHIPRYSQQEMNIVESKMCAILQELSHTCILLGKSENQLKSLKQQLHSSRKSNSSDVTTIAKLQDTNNSLTDRLEDTQKKMAVEEANRDAWMARAKAAEEESQKAWERCFSNSVGRDGAGDTSKERVEEYVQQIVHLQEALQMANGEAEEAVQLCASVQESLQSEIAQIREEQRAGRKETSTMLERLNTEKLQLEQERNSLSIELEVLRDTNGAEKASQDVEKSRVREAMTVQQNLHIEKLMEKEETLHRLNGDNSALKDEVSKLQNSYRSLQSETDRVTSECNVYKTQLMSLKKDQLEVETKYDTLKKENLKLVGTIESKCETADSIIKDLKSQLRESKLEHEGYANRFENEQLRSSNLEEQVQHLRDQLTSARSANITSDTELVALRREYDQLKMSSETASKHATEHVNRVRRRYEDRERELLDALTSADDDVVAARRDLALLQESTAKEEASLSLKLRELEEKNVQSQEAIASLSASKQASESISSQQTSHLQNEASRLLQLVREMEQAKIEQRLQIDELMNKCCSLDEEKKSGFHANLCKQLNNQVATMSTDMEALSEDNMQKQALLEEWSQKVKDTEHLQEIQLNNLKRDNEALKADYEAKLADQQVLLSKMEDKLVMLHESHTDPLQSPVYDALNNKIALLEREIEVKAREESKFHKLMQSKDGELMDLNAKYDALEISTQISLKAANEQTSRLRLRAEDREQELLTLIKEKEPTSLCLSQDNNSCLSETMVTINSLQNEVQNLSVENAELRKAREKEQADSTKTIISLRSEVVDTERKLADAMCEIETGHSKHEDYTVELCNIRNRAVNEAESYKEQLAEVKASASKSISNMKAEIARVNLESEKEIADARASQRNLEKNCESLTSNIRKLQMEKASCEEKCNELLSTVDVLKVKKKEIMQQQDVELVNQKMKIKMNYEENISSLVAEQATLKNLLSEAQSQLSHESEKFCRTKREFAALVNTCGKLRADMETLRRICHHSNSDFNSLIGELAQKARRSESLSKCKIESLEAKCKELVGTLEQQQNLIESANQQQKDATQNRTALLSIIEDWRSKTSEAMHTILHMQQTESTLKLHCGQERENSRRLNETLREKEVEIVQLWELVDRLADEVKKTTNKSETLVKSIESWNSARDSGDQIPVELSPNRSSLTEGCMPPSPVEDLSADIANKERLYSKISQMFPTSPDNRSDKYKHLNIPKLLVESVSSSYSSSLLPQSDKDQKEDYNTYEDACDNASQEGQSMTSAAILSRGDFINIATNEDQAVSVSYDFSYDFENDKEQEEGDVSGHIIGLHDYCLDETTDWYLSSDTDELE